MSMVLSLPIVFACGNDDDSGKIVDGVYVAPGKKLVELQLKGDNDPDPLIFKAEYDSKGRLTKMCYRKIEPKYDSETQNYVYVYGEDVNMAIIDYDFRIVRVFGTFNPNYVRTYDFILNEEGYISQIGECVLNYDSNGYLTGVKELNTIGSFAYNSNELIKASISSLYKNEMSLYYISYGNEVNQGDIYINIQQTDDRKSRYLSPDLSDIAVFIAYQSGLFGKVGKTFIHLQSKSELSSLVGFNNDYGFSVNGKMTFICE